MNTYLAFYKGKKLEVKASTSYAAQQLAAQTLKARKAYEVSVFLVENEKGEPVIHNPAILD